MDSNTLIDGYDVYGENGSVGRRRIPLATSVQQAVAYGKFLPDSYIPQTTLLETIYGHHTDIYSYSNRLLSAVCWEGRQYCVSAAGTDRRRIRLTRLGRGNGEGGSCAVRQCNSSIEGIFCNVDDGLQGAERRRPIFAAKTADSVEFFRLYDEDGQSRTFTLNQLGPGFKCSTNRLEDYSWNQYMSKNGVVVTASCNMHECDCDHAHSLTVQKIDVSPYDASTGNSTHRLGTVRCRCSSLHPSLSLAAMYQSLVRVDFREKQSITSANTLYRFSQSNFITALAVSKRHVCTNQYSFAASTASHVHLFDMRKALRPMASWEHYINSSSTQDRSLIEFCTAGPDGLDFSSDGGRDFLLATSSFQGKGVELHWNSTKNAASIAYNNGNFVQYDQGGSISSCESAFSFHFEPTDVDSVNPIEPPEVAYDTISAEKTMLQSLWDNEYEILYANSDIPGQERVCRLLGNMDSGSDRDLGISILDQAWELGAPTENPLVYRLTAKGNIIVQTIASRKMSTLPSRATAGQHKLTVHRPIPSTTSSVSTKRKVDESRVYLDSNSYAASRDNRVEAPMHGSLFRASQLEYANNFSENRAIGIPEQRVESFLKQLLESSPGFPISAYEAWSILQRCLVDERQNVDEDHVAHDLEGRIPHLEGIKGYLPERHTSRNAKINSKSEKPDLSTLIELMQMLPTVSENVNPPQDHQTEVQSKTAWPCLPPEQFLRIWHSIDHSQHGSILSWELQSPALMAERLSHARPSKKVQKTTLPLHTSIVSMKMLKSGEMAMRAKDELSNSSNMLTKLMDRWDQNHVRDQTQ